MLDVMFSVLLMLSLLMEEQLQLRADVIESWQSVDESVSRELHGDSSEIQKKRTSQLETVTEGLVKTVT
jgi:hypothetical protein